MAIHVRLWPAGVSDGETETIDFEVPDEQGRELGEAEQVIFKGEKYQFSGLFNDTANFRQLRGTAFELKDEWIKAIRR